jgi:hypothetical protein
MPKEAEYRINAFDSLQLAEHARTTEDRVRLLRLADAWMHLADRAKRLKDQLHAGQRPTHPRVASVLGEHPKS